MIELRHLRYFVAVAEELSFRKAAERVHIDQTPLSRTIRDLENRWGITLFVRTPRVLRLTLAGVELLKHARELLARLERAELAVRATDSRYREPLRLGVDESTVQPNVADCLVRWRVAAPDISIEILEMNAAELNAALSSERIDVGFSFGLPANHVEINQQAAWSSEVVAIVPPNHPLAVEQAVSLTDLFAFPTVACTATYHPGISRQVANIIQQHALVRTVACEARTLTGYLTCVAAGQGVGIADADHMRALRRNDIIVVPLLEKVHIATYVLHKRRSSGLSEILQRFLTHATNFH